MPEFEASEPQPRSDLGGFLPWVATLVHAHRTRLLAYARRRGLDAEDALDAVQDSFGSFLRLPEARAIASSPHSEADDALKLLTVILRHNVLNRRRQWQRRARAAAMLEAEPAARDTESSEELIARAEQLAVVRGCIDLMANLQREVVRLALLDGEPHGEIARVLGISPGYVRVLLHRARTKLVQCDTEEVT